MFGSNGGESSRAGEKRRRSSDPEEEVDREVKRLMSVIKSGRQGIELPEVVPWEREVGAKPWRRLMYHPSAQLIMTPKAQRYLERTTQEDAGEGMGFRIFEAAREASQVHRFVDQRQSAFEGTILPDGSNVDARKHRDLKSAHEIYKRWLTALHLDSMIQIVPNPPTFVVDSSHVNMFTHLEYFSAEWLWNNEADGLGNRVKHSPHDFYPEHFRTPYEFRWVEQWREHLADAVAQVKAIANWHSAANVPVEKCDEAVHEVMLGLPMVVWVLQACTYAEEQFDHTLLEDHVEDVHMDKRLFMVSETEAEKFRRLQTASDLIQTHEPVLRTRCTEISKNFRKSFCYRRIRDWGYGRSWKKMFVLLSDRWKKAIDQVNEEFSRSKLAYDVLDVHPKTIESLGMDNACHSCQEDYAVGELMMQLRCQHHVHPACAFALWDEPHRFQDICPICRNAPLMLRERVTGIVTQKVDEDWFFPIHGHDRHTHVVQEYLQVRDMVMNGSVRVDELEPSAYIATMIHVMDQRNGRKRAQDEVLYGGGGKKDVDAAQREAEELQAREQARQQREGIDPEEAALQSQARLREELLARNTQNAEEREGLLQEPVGVDMDMDDDSPSEGFPSEDADDDEIWLFND